MKYDRQLLLAGAKRDAILELAEVRAYGSDSYGDADYVSVYGLRPGDWHARGIRLLGRTAVECTRDELADRIAEDAAAVAAHAGAAVPPFLVDPFAGSGNTLYWLARRLSVARGLGFEMDPGVFALTRENLRVLGLPLEVLNVDYRAGLANVAPVEGQLVVAFVAPPWGDALHPVSGLDLRRTHPPIAEVTGHLVERFGRNRMLFVVQIHESVDPASVTELAENFDWSALNIYELNARGQNHGAFLATVGWTPPEGAQVPELEHARARARASALIPFERKMEP